MRDFPSLIKAWLDQLDLPPQTLEAYRRNLVAFLRYSAQEGPPTTSADIPGLSGGPPATAQARAVQVYLITLKLFFRWAARHGFCENLAEEVRNVKVDERNKKDPLRQDQVRAVLDAFKDGTSLRNLRDRALIWLMVTTGLRDIEIIRANVEDLREQFDTVVLFVQGKGRTEKSESVKVAPPVLKALTAYQEAREALQERADPQEGSKGGPCKDAFRGPRPLFASLAIQNAGQRLTTRSLSRIIKRRFQAARLCSPRLTAHSLRHTAATLNLLKGRTLEETQQLLRHTSLNTTLLYAHALERAQNPSEERIAQAIFWGAAPLSGEGGTPDCSSQGTGSLERKADVRSGSEVCGVKRAGQ